MAASDAAKLEKTIGQTRVLLFWPNIVDYVRIVMAVGTFFGPWDQREQPLLFAALYVAGFFLDGVDGILARSLNQVSSFGAFLDVCIDNGVRQVMWTMAVPGPVGCLLPALEWLVLAATHSQGGAAWKEGCFRDAPWQGVLFLCGAVDLAAASGVPPKRRRERSFSS
ncbi:Phosphatidylinositol synthase [Klebsormidium nitens]|uniref:Phosphatidylinositol synthase n=1 Tax=Klebsormidium nitens TaxID=105231 RepID=A0A1Y1IEB6_KLENI|nr:Phosphatidylinositol synthase [Klebsormidium nitens]|eukprot:GAQ89270.1 Phosphatidylinositol synthase [Klebsormidium nitens]